MRLSLLLRNRSSRWVLRCIPNGSVIEYSYDNQDRIISIGETGAKNTISYTDISESSEYAITTITDANGNLKKEYVDEAGLTTSVIDEDVTSGAKIERMYDYTANGNLAKETYSDGSYLYMEYDQMNRLVKKTSYDSDMAEESVITFTYNAFGDMISVSTVRNGSLVSSYEWTYDNRGNVLTESVAYGEEDPETTTYEYDKDSRLTKTIYPSTSDLGTVSYSYDYLGNVTEIKKNGQVVSKYSYDNLYRETSKKDYTNPGIETSFVEKKTTYSDIDRISKIEYVTNSNAPVESYEYTYDKVGNILTRVRTKGSEQTETRNYEYSGFYDALTKTTTTKGEETSITTYTYDPVGNRTSMTEAGITTNYTYNGLNQLVSKTDNAGTTTYNYDAKGNQIEETSPNSTLTFDYLVTGELEEVKSGSLTLQQNSYNHEGIRVAKLEDSKTRTYYYDQGSVAFALDKGTAQTVSTLSTANLRALDGEVIGSYRGEDYYIYTEDIQGSTGKILDDSLSAKNTYSYTDFGEVEVSASETNGNTTSLIANEICYTGAIYDETTGLHYLNARYYDPENGRFISQDTYRGDKNEISQWHLYAYCANNPINYTDPSGHIKVDNWIASAVLDTSFSIIAGAAAPGLSVVQSIAKIIIKSKNFNSAFKSNKKKLINNVLALIKRAKTNKFINKVANKISSFFGSKIGKFVKSNFCKYADSIGSSRLEELFWKLPYINKLSNLTAFSSYGSLIISIFDYYHHKKEFKGHIQIGQKKCCNK